MELSAYLRIEDGKNGPQLARDLDVAVPTVYQWASRKRPVPELRATQLEIATDGAVRRWDLRPHDWHLIWPELIGIDGAPAVPNEEAA